jgi:putative hydrolase of the HAD superfamily
MTRRRRPRRRGGTVWIFDLDNTLHDANRHIFPQLNRSMTAYLERHLGLDAEGANALRVDYWRRYGATLLGLMRHHGVDPQHFLRETHRFAELGRAVLRNPLLRSVLTRLPGRKLVFSNAPVH